MHNFRQMDTRTKLVVAALSLTAIGAGIWMLISTGMG